MLHSKPLQTFCLLCAIFLQVSGLDRVSSYNAEEMIPRLSYKLDIGGDANAWVYDNVIPLEYTGVMKEYLQRVVWMQFMVENYTWADRGQDWNEGSTPWQAKLNTADFESFSLWKNAKPLIEKSLGKKVFVEYVQSEFLRALDPKPMVNGSHCANDRYMATVFLPAVWQHDNYGQVSLYSSEINSNVSSHPRWECQQTIHPKTARLVVWPSCHAFIAHPPSVNIFTYLLSLTFWFTTNDTLSPFTTPLDNSNKEEAVYGFGNFAFTNKDADRVIDYEKFLTRTFHDNGNRGIYVFDNLYTKDELRQWRRHILSHGRKAMSLYDGSALEDNDNVQTISIYMVEEFVKTAMWKRVYDVACYVSGKNQWYPYDVALNYIRSADHTRIHPDAEINQYEYTYLLYLNEEVGVNQQGETVWFVKKNSGKDGIHNFTGIGGEEYEPVAAVRPKFGRVVIFRNIVEHSARPLTTVYLGSRYTFAVKVSENKRLSLIKQIYEKMDNFQQRTPSENKIRKEFIEGIHDDEKKSPVTTDDLEIFLRKTKEKLSHEAKISGDEILEQLRNM